MSSNFFSVCQLARHLLHVHCRFTMAPHQRMLKDTFLAAKWNKCDQRIAECLKNIFSLKREHFTVWIWRLYIKFSHGIFSTEVLPKWVVQPEKNLTEAKKRSVMGILRGKVATYWHYWCDKGINSFNRYCTFNTLFKK